MNITFFLIGGIIFSVYIGLTCWNIYYSSERQKQDNYPNLNDDLNASSNDTEKNTAE